MIGELRHRISFQSATRVPDGGGGFTESWANITVQPEVYAAIAPLSGSEQLRHHQLETAVTHRVLIRYRADITPGMRIVREGVIYDIFSVLDSEGQGTWLEILAAVKKS